MKNVIEKKKIAIVTRKMITGGVEKALLGMLEKLDFNELEVDLYLEQLGGDLFESIPNKVNIVQIPSKIYKEFYPFKHPKKFINSIYYRFKVKREKNYLKQCKLYAQCYPIVDKKYDMAISYHAPNTIPVFYTINNINANKKVLWLHGDIEMNGGKSSDAYSYYKLYDIIFSVSKSVKNSFDKNYIDLSNKSYLFYNYIDKEKLIYNSIIGDKFKDCFSGIRILTIGRLDKQKGYDLAIEASYRLKKDGYKIRWYVCGEGAFRGEMEDLIDKYNLRDDFILLGNQTNPYGYLKECDIYVQPSKCEGYCTTTNEARLLVKPVVTTKVSGANEQFIHKKTGIITSISSEEIYEGIKYLIDNPEKRYELINNLKLISNYVEEDIKKLVNIIY